MTRLEQLEKEILETKERLAALKVKHDASTDNDVRDALLLYIQDINDNELVMREQEAEEIKRKAE